MSASALRCTWPGPVSILALVLGGLGFAACSSDDEPLMDPLPNDAGVEADADGGGTFDAGACERGEYVCEGSIAKACDGNGGFESSTDCAAAGATCTEPYGCVVCTAGAGTCQNGLAKVCRADGTGFIEFACDTVQGMVCDPDGCKGSCSPAELIPSYYGCNYFPTVSINSVWSGFPFAVVVANVADEEATVTVTRGGTTVSTDTVPAKGVTTITLPWVPELKGGDVNACQTPPDPGATRLVADGAYRLRTNVPVTVYQFSPLSYEIDPVPDGCPLGQDCPGGNGAQCLSYSNDASLLLPSTVWTNDYSVVTWPSVQGRAAFATITAMEDGTEVKVFGAGSFTAGAGIDGSGNGTVTLGAGDVLELIASHEGEKDAYLADITGTQVHASKPVQVIAGHSCANIPEPNTLACDHLEHAIFPTESLGTDYLVTYPAAVASESPHVVRIVAAEDATTVRFDPPIHDDVQLAPGDPPIELRDVTQDVRVYADKALLIAQFMQGQASVPSGAGDPSMALAIPTQQFRKSYIFVAPSSFDSNFVNVLAPAGASVTLDGETVPAGSFTAIGSSGFGVARLSLDGGETHTLEAGQPVGILVYGYGRYTSYMYPGGLDFKRITPPPVY